MKKKNNAENSDNQKLHELEKAEIEKEKANRTKIHIQNRTVLVIVTGGLCLITVFLGIYMANKLAANKNGLNSSSSSYTEPQSSSASLNVSSSNPSVFTQSGNSDTVSSGTNSQNPPVSNSNSNSNSVSGVGISSAGGVGNVPFPPSGQVSGTVSGTASASGYNTPEFTSSDDGNTHLPDVVDTQTPDITTPDVPPQITPSTGSGNNGNSQSQSEGRSPFDDMPFFNHGGGGMESTGTVDEQISDTGITGEGFFH